MSRWFRFYDDTLNDPKTLKLSDKTFRVWVGILCAASKNDGKIPLFEDLAILLRISPVKLQPEIEKLIAAELIDHDDDGMKPHNWDRRQYKSDVSTDRVKRHRNGKRNVSVTPPETEADTEQKVPEATASDAIASPPAIRDIRADLFGRGLKSLEAMTGKTPDSCRRLLGLWLKSVDDEAIQVLGAIDEAERNRVADPVAWINRMLKPRAQNGHGKQTVHTAVDDLLARVQSIDAPVPSGLCDPAGQAPVRRLPAR